MVQQLSGTVPWFRDWDPVDLAWLERLGKTASFVNWETLCCGRAREGTLFVILRGTAEVMLPDPVTGEERAMVTLRAGAVFGEVSFLDGKPRRGRVQAKGPCVCWTLDRSGLSQLQQQAPGTAAVLLARLAEGMANRLVRASEEIVRLQDRQRPVNEEQRRRVGERALRSLWARWFGGKRDA